MKAKRFHPPTGRMGFTLVELMVTLGVIAVLVTVAIPVLSQYHKLARKVECQVSVIHFLRAQDLYYLDKDRFYQKIPGMSWSESIGWTAASRPDQPDKYRFPELGVEFRPSKLRGYRITVWDIHWSFWGWSFFYQGLRLQVTTDENFFDSRPDPELYTYWKYNAQSSWGWGTNGDWQVLQNDFWFDIPSAL